ncbi:MAG: hypothetical protein NTX22_13485 [Ignavibacteriales bacterium]|nr:hypothetical protein [Ignavibacteriales bacterium]
MKSLFNICFAVILLFVTSCAPSYLTKEQSERVINHNVNLSKEEIKIKVLSYINETAGSAKAVIQSNEDGFLTGNVIFYIGTSDLIGVYPDYLEATFLIKYQNNNYRAKYVVKNVYVIIDKKIDIHPAGWVKYYTQIDTALTRFDKSLLEYMANSSNF